MMKLTIQELVDRIVAEVVRRIRQLQLEAEPETLVLCPGPVTMPELLQDWLREQLTEEPALVRLGEEPPWPGALCLDRTDLTEAELLRRIHKARRVYLACPRAELLAAVGRGDDSTLPARAMIKAVLWQKQTGILLDYPAPRFHRNSFLGAVADNLEALTASGVEIIDYTARAGGAYSLITETEVREAARTGETLRGTAKAIVTRHPSG